MRGIHSNTIQKCVSDYATVVSATIDHEHSPSNKYSRWHFSFFFLFRKSNNIVFNNTEHREHDLVIIIRRDSRSGRFRFECFVLKMTDKTGW